MFASLGTKLATNAPIPIHFGTLADQHILATHVPNIAVKSASSKLDALQHAFLLIPDVTAQVAPK